MTHEQAQKMWRESNTVWTPRKSGELWQTGWEHLFGKNHKPPHDDEYDDGEGGRLRIGDLPHYPGIPIVFVRIDPADKQEIRLWKITADNIRPA